jgi:FKBP-type peptidyl-prolyl cis-trans isomerase SlyD
MKITPQCVVALTWTLKDTLGEILDELDEPVEFLLGGDDLLATIEKRLQGHEAGDAIDLHLEPENTFGDYNENLVFLEARKLFPSGLEEGMTFDGAGLPAGCTPDMPTALIYTVTEIYPEHVVLDGNHPLAGIAIRLSLKVESVRQASEEEVGQGTLGTGFFRLAPHPPGNNTLH